MFNNYQALMSFDKVMCSLGDGVMRSDEKVKVKIYAQSWSPSPSLLEP